MRYISTRGGAEPRTFCDILLEGLAPDGGLYLPEEYPHVTPEILGQWRTALAEQGYAALAYEVLRLFIDDVPAEDLREICARTYTAEAFGNEEIVSITDLGDDVVLEGLSHGPTLAFKDMAMQLLGALFEYELGRRGKELNVLGATSGDTGSAAEYAMRGRPGIRVFMLSPKGRMSDFQRAQMYTLDDANIHNIVIDGTFDDCQDLIKAVSADAAFKREAHIGSVNSINWARLVAQVVYYVAGYLRATASNDEEVSFAVPTGNFGNICAGHIARQMGLPIRHLLLATNENNVLEEFFRTGVYRPRSSQETVKTSSPSMDISKASNFERFVFDLVGRDPERILDLFAAKLVRLGQFDLSDDPDFPRCGEWYGFRAAASDHGDRLRSIREVWEDRGLLIDPHTADAVCAARRLQQPGERIVVLETAQPVKFAETIREALGQAPEVPEAYAHLAGLERHVVELPPDVDRLKAYIAGNIA
ncbi:threonine synthase [Raineyella fluvialis]|uniref:Threonine synthase n=1 Tax=Raineyella fluvialis TaxID=2662261 RepID=A0A5Q2FCM1_9ACTN|nr:threonine synthase [Raineyella fluvialis]QGF24539.1 threonine synthase [Raineyella fluvialis]